MNTREIAAELRLSHWAKIMQDRNESGLSIKEYCKTAGFHENIYFYWQRKLREAACQNLLPNPQAETACPDKTSVPGGWAVCETTITTAKDKPLTIEVGGCKVLADADVDPELLLKVCRALVMI